MFRKCLDDLGFEAREQGERVFAVDLLQFFSAEKAAFLQPFDVIGNVKLETWHLLIGRKRGARSIIHDPRYVATD